MSSYWDKLQLNGNRYRFLSQVGGDPHQLDPDPWPRRRRNPPKRQYLQRGSKTYFRWRRKVLKRDGFRCVICGAGGHLEAHHIQRWIDKPELRNKVANGVTLCKACHDRGHQGDGRAFKLQHLANGDIPEYVPDKIKKLTQEQIDEMMLDRLMPFPF